VSYRGRRRVDWDEELRKTERIRRKGLFISALGFGVAMIFIVGANRLNSGGVGVEISRKIIFTLCFVLAMFLLRNVLGRRKRLRREWEEKEYILALERLRRNREADKADNNKGAP
jgi:hypothetical protein